MKGWYIYADYTQGKFWTLIAENSAISFYIKSTLIINNILQSIALTNPVSFGQAASGELYVIIFDVKLFKFTDSSTPLPLNLVAFSAKKSLYNEVALTWKTTSESDFLHFEMQKSANS